MDYSTILLRLRITPNYMGYHQMLTAPKIFDANPEALTMVTKWLYPAVAKRHHTNLRRVERNLRTVVKVAWKTDQTFLQEMSLLVLPKQPAVSYLSWPCF